MKLLLAALICSLPIQIHAQATTPAVPVLQPGATPTTETVSSRALAPQAPNLASDTYIISAGDTLDLNVWKEAGMSALNVPVRPDGKISLALLGDVPAAGSTPAALGAEIALRLKKYVNEPLVTVTVSGVHPKEVYLLGEVQKIGPVVLSPGMTVLQAISAAGGLTTFARKKLYILRKGAGGEQKISFDYKKAIKSGDQQGVVLIPGDTIVAP